MTIIAIMTQGTWFEKIEIHFIFIFIIVTILHVIFEEWNHAIARRE